MQRTHRSSRPHARRSRPIARSIARCSRPITRALAGVVLTAVALVALSCARGPEDRLKPRHADSDLKITSPAFASGETIPTRFTCDGDNVSPPLVFSGVPEGTASLVLVVDDPDAPDPAEPMVRWVHWILYDLPPDTRELPEGVANDVLPAGTRVGRNDWGRQEYGGPCPPVGEHRYVHTLYALDVTVGDLDEGRRRDLEAAMEGHVLARARWIGRYERP